MWTPKAAGLPEPAAIRKIKAPQPPKQVENWLDALMAMNISDGGDVDDVSEEDVSEDVSDMAPCQKSDVSE